jgi:hypothetical protein
VSLDDWDRGFNPRQPCAPQSESSSRESPKAAKPEAHQSKERCPEQPEKSGDRKFP